MDQWTARIETHTRRDVLKICAILARGIGHEAILDKRLGVFISGSKNSGKSAIVDGLVAAFSDDMSSYSLPAEPLMEGYESEARFHKIVKFFPVKSQDCSFSLLHYLSEMDLGYYNLERSAPSPVARTGIDFITVFGGSTLPRGALSMLFTHSTRSKPCPWPRKFEITVRDQFLKTEIMEEALDNLRAFHQHRQSRNDLTPRPDQMPDWAQAEF